MDDAVEAASFEDWFEHQAWVRALALRLCADASSADDVVQDSWLETARGGAPRSSRAWLGGVVRHLVRRARRQEGARGERELRAAKHERVPSADTLLAQAELQRRVLAAVASLDEPQRVVVLLHHYEGVSSEAIARRLGVPSSTVRTRLARAHEQLRAKLDRDYGARSAWSLAFAPTFAFKSSAGAAAGIGVAMKVQLALAAAAVVVAAVLLWPKTAAEHELAGARASELAATSEPVAALDAASADQRAAASTETNVANAPAAVEHVLVFGDLLGTNGAKVEGDLSFSDETTGSSRKATLSARNTYSIFGLAPGTYRVSSWVRGFVPLDDTLVLPSDQEKVRHDITLERALVLPVKFVDRSTGQALDTTFGWRAGIGAVATLERPTRIAGVLGIAPYGAGVGAWFAKDHRQRDTLTAGNGVLEIRSSPPLWVSCVLRDTVLESRLIRGDESELVFAIDTAELEGKLGSLIVRCVDATTHAPIAGASVQADNQQMHSSGTPTDANGSVRLDGLGPGLLRIEIDAGGHASLERWQRFELGQTVDLGTLELASEAHLSGRVVDAAGVGQGVHMTAFGLRDDLGARDVDNLMNYDSANDGAFTIDWVPSGRVRVTVVDSKWAIAALDVDATSGGAENLELRVEHGTEVWLKSPRAQHTQLDVLVVDSAGRPLAMRSLYPPQGNRFRLAPGHYELRTVVDDEVVARRPLDVGSERVVIEIAAP